MEEIVPTTLDDAINAVAGLNSRRDAYDRLGRNEEPMEVTEVRANDNEKLSKMVEKLSTKLAKMEIATQANSDQQTIRPTRNQNRNRDNAPARKQSFNCAAAMTRGARPARDQFREPPPRDTRGRNSDTTYTDGICHISVIRVGNWVGNTGQRIDLTANTRLTFTQ